MPQKISPDPAGQVELKMRLVFLLLSVSAAVNCPRAYADPLFGNVFSHIFGFFFLAKILTKKNSEGQTKAGNQSK